MTHGEVEEFLSQEHRVGQLLSEPGDDAGEDGMWRDG